MIHQPLGGYQGQATDVLIHAEEILKIKKMLIQRMAYHTGQDAAKLEADMERDRWLSSPDALEYGIIDGIIGE